VTAELCLVSAEGGSGFMEEILEVVADAVRRAGHRARTAVGAYPDPGPDTVYVVVPHEYFVVTPHVEHPGEELRARTIGFCVEHPGTATFEKTAELLPGLGGAVDINDDSTAELRRRGFAVEHFQLGYSPLWDAWGGDPESTREIDVTYLGTAERRRSVLLASYWRDLADLRVRLLIPPHEPMGPERPDFLPGKAKHAHLANSRFLLNLHRERSRALEWVRILEALCNGSVVLTEPSADLDPVVPGKHLVVARAASLGAAAAALAADHARERDLRSAGYDFARNSLDLLGSARLLVELADAVLAQSPGVPHPAPATGERNRGEPPLAVDTPSWEVRFAGNRSLGALSASPSAASAMAQEVIEARRTAGRQWVPAAATPVFPEVTRAEVDVLLVQGPGEPDPSGLLDDLLGGTVLPARILFGADGVSPPPRPRAADLLVHELPLGRGATRNELLTRSAAEWVLVLNAGMRALPRLVERLLGSASPDVDVVHSPVGDPIDGLVGALPPEPRRLATLPYLGSGYLIRRRLLDKLGGWAEDPLLEGLEDHVLWSLVAGGGHRSALVQQVLLNRVRPDPVTRPLDLDPHRVWSLAGIHGRRMS
jgi:hypothetical protein